MKYDYKAVEAKWQKVWEDEKTFHVEIDHKKPKFYALVEFPYPSGAGLHVGHPRSYTALDVVSRKRRKNGYNVLYPMGWDAFGLPTENFAMKNHIHPAIVTKNNVDHFRSQLKALGFKTAAMALSDRSVSIDDEALAREPKLAIVLGTEGDGLSRTTIASCDYTVKIPMSHGVDSLNVAAASAVAFWQLGKQ